ncbi:MAG: argininosuccinate lyase, partial [Candidatus Binatus sp.]
AKFWPKLRFDTKRMRAVAGGFALATDLAEYLVSRGTPFRRAHEIVSAIVRETAEAGRTLEDLSSAELRRYSSGFGADATALLRAENSIARRAIEGGPAPSAVKRRLKELGRR